MNTERPQHPHRVLLAILSLSPGGAERVVSELANWWAGRGTEVAILTFRGREHDHYSLNPGIQRIPLDFWRESRTPWEFAANRLRLPFRVREAVRAFGPDAAISFIDLTNILMVTALAGTKIPVIVSERIDPRHHRIGLVWSFARRLLYPLSRALVVQTHAVARWAGRVVPKKKVAVIPNFVREMPGPGENAFRERVVLAVGRLDRQKGHDLLIRAFAALGRGREGWRLVILGEGPERSSLERLALTLGLGCEVIMPGVVREPAEWLYKAGLFVLPSRYEGFPNSLLEAMACGCAVIAADCPSGPGEIVSHGQNGLLVPPGDVDALSASLLRLMGDENLRASLGNRARDVRSRFSREKIMAQWDELVVKVSGRNT